MTECHAVYDLSGLGRFQLHQLLSAWRERDAGLPGGAWPSSAGDHEPAAGDPPQRRGLPGGAFALQQVLREL